MVSPTGKDPPLPGISLPHTAAKVRPPDCVQENLGMTAFLEHPPLCNQAPGKSKTPHLGAGSSKTSTLNRNTWGPVTIQSCCSHRTFMGQVFEQFLSIGIALWTDVWCNVRSFITSLALTRSQGHDIKNIPKDYQVSGGPRSFSHKH